MWLFDIIKDGTLVDNRSYFVNNGIFTNKSLGNQLVLKLKQKASGLTLKMMSLPFGFFKFSFA
jgi:hypothetical protein